MMWLIVILIVLAAIYFYKSQNLDYWNARNVPNVKAYPYVGNMGKSVFRIKSTVNLMCDMYKMYPDVRYSGHYKFSVPYLMLKDPEIIKAITVKDFDHFVNRRIVLSEDVDQLFGKSLISLKDQRWKDMRATLSPSFTSSKMRSMFVLISECGEQFVDFFVKKSQDNNGEPMTIEMKDVFTRFTNDVIATTAFGLKVDSLLHPQNEFYMTGKKVFTPSLKSIFTLFGYSIFPSLMKKLHISIISNSVTTFFKKIILDTMKTREEEHIIRPDMIHLLMEARKGKLRHDDENEINSNNRDAGFAAIEESNLGKELRSDKMSMSDDDLIAQAFIFFVAGFETSSTAMSFTLYELALNPDYQIKLQTEIDEISQESDEKLTYEMLNSMKYMDMVISESLRKWSPVIQVDRICGKKYILPLPHSYENENQTITIEPGVGIWLPIHAIHHDPKFYPDPEKFDPERFSDENKHNIKPFTYLPFGAGPRACIGTRFALMEIKIVLFYILSKFDFVVCEKTKMPIEVGNTAFNLTAKGGLWLKMKPRNTTQL